MAFMRAKMKVGSVQTFFNGEKEKTGEIVTFHGVSKTGSYPPDGSDEDNTFAKFSPSVSLSMHIANPALLGKLEPGAAFYLDFTPVEQPLE